jgi:acetyl-CoA synthetase
MMPNEKQKNETFPFGQSFVWYPNQEWIENSNLQEFIKIHKIPDYDTLLARSTEDIRWFWEAVLKHLDIRFYSAYKQIVDTSRGIQFPRWCVHGQMNIIYNCLDKWQNTPTKNRTAILWENENGDARKISYQELYSDVNKCANTLKNFGLMKGDVVGLYMPMTPELIVAFLAVIKLGGIILPLFSGFGPTAISTRLNDAGAKIVFTVDAMQRRNKMIAMKPVLDEALMDVNSVRAVVVKQNYEGLNINMQVGRDVWWHQTIPNSDSECETLRTSAEDTLMIIYTSGTTGKPKGAVHTHCGFPVKAAQDMYHSMDLKAGEVMFWMSDMGWMMGPWEVFGTLIIGASMLLYDGAPDYPKVSRVWSLVEKHKVTHLGITPSFIRAIMPRGTNEIKSHDLNSLRMVGSTGSPWDPQSWSWVFKNVLQEKKPIFNYSGGTEISGGILCGNLFKPLKPCAFSGPIPGMDADVVDESGNPVRRAVGELVVRQPWIGMTRGFWKDEQRYLNTYWDHFPDIWFHGDYAAIDEDGLWYLLGRSDDTIKVAGKRLGPAEVESIINSHPMISDSAAIGVPHSIKGEVVVVFCVLEEETDNLESLRENLIERVTRELGNPLKPREIKFVKALPKTRNAKIMHRVIRAVYLGKDTGDLSSLEDPASVQAIRNAI